MELERLVPLFHIFLHSPSPEGEASAWLDQHSHQSNPPHHLLTSAFLTQLLAPANVVSANPNAPATIERCPWVQTLPLTVQARILSFLAIENHRFCHRSLHSLASQILDSVAKDGNVGGGQFWVARAARHLLDEMSLAGSCAVVAAGEEEIDAEEDFCSMPQWLKDAAAISRAALPWPPLPPRQLHRRTHTLCSINDDADAEGLSPLSMQEEEVFEELGNSHVEPTVSDLSVSPKILEKATALKDEISSMASPSDALRVCRDISRLFLEAGKGGGWDNPLAILQTIEPWEAEDEAALLILSHLLGECGLDYPDWPSHAFAAVILPKLLSLRRPTSRALQASCIEFCKSYPKLVGSSTLFPLIYRREGINVALRDVLSRILKEMHPSYVSAFCHRLLCVGRTRGDFICLPCHLNMISDKVLWTESMFSLFQQIMSWDISLTPDAVDELISILQTVHSEFPKSLKFGSFLLCLVRKSAHAVKFHKIALMEIARKTNTFVTKSVISKLENH